MSKASIKTEMRIRRTDHVRLNYNYPASGQSLETIRKFPDSRSVKHESLKHPKAIRFLHWGTALAIIVSVAVMFIRGYIEDKTYRIGLLELHRQLGLFVLVGVFMRLIVRLWAGLARPVVPMSFLVRFCAGLCHLSLYILLIALPLVGWAVSNAHNVDLDLFGLVHLPRLVLDDPDLADELTDKHLWLSWGLLAVLVFHIGAALIHHYVMKDKVLKAMLPGR